MKDFTKFFSGRALSKSGDDVDFLFAGALVVFHEKSARTLDENPHLIAIMSRAGHEIVSTKEPPTLRADEAKILAMDTFGGLYVSFGKDNANAVVKIDPETAEVAKRFVSERECAEFIESDARVETGWPLWLEWADLHGATEWPMRLVPITPFVLGGTFDVQNMDAVTWEDAFERYDVMSLKLHGLPDGEKISFDS